MNKEFSEGRWNQLKGKVREKWSRLTDDDVGQIQGNFQQLVGKVQERYGKTRDEAEREVKGWISS
jgi:uncharacterized protein YjbJ (UPF0337 family)